MACESTFNCKFGFRVLTGGVAESELRSNASLKVFFEKCEKTWTRAELAVNAGESQATASRSGLELLDL